jgi:hypothetical protein
MKTKTTSVSFFVLVLLLASLAPNVYALADRRFDIVTFCCPCSQDAHLCQSQFDHLNWTSANGHFLAMGSDAHRSEVNGNGNFLCAYYNTLNTGFGSMTGAQKADDIENNYIIPNFTASGVKPTWVILNEISGGSWPGNQSYRTWVKDVVARLNTTYNHSVVICSPFANPAQNDADWQAVSGYAYIAVECYLSGKAINASGNSVSWCQTQYQNSKNSYVARGVPATKLYLIEHFGQTTATLPDGTPVTWGRLLVSYAGWDNAINARSTAAHNVGFAGFVSFGWDKNAMLVSDTDMIHFEDTYRAKVLP